MMKRLPVFLPPVLAALVLSVLLAASAQAAEEVISQTYASPGLTQTSLEALLWEACPEELDGAQCLVRSDGKTAWMTAPLSVHRAVALELARVEAAGETRLRIDLVVVSESGGRELRGLPASVRQALTAVGTAPGVGFRSLDSATVSVADRARVHFDADGHQFSINLNPRSGTRRAPLRRHLDLSYLGTGTDALSGQILNAVVSLTPGETTLAGITHFQQGGPELLVLLTPEG